MQQSHWHLLFCPLSLSLSLNEQAREHMSSRRLDATMHTLQINSTHGKKAECSIQEQDEQRRMSSGAMKVPTVGRLTREGYSLPRNHLRTMKPAQTHVRHKRISTCFWYRKRSTHMIFQHSGRVTRKCCFLGWSHINTSHRNWGRRNNAKK